MYTIYKYMPRQKVLCTNESTAGPQITFSYNFDEML